VNQLSAAPLREVGNTLQKMASSWYTSWLMWGIYAHACQDPLCHSICRSSRFSNSVV